MYNENDMNTQSFITHSHYYDIITRSEGTIQSLYMSVFISAAKQETIKVDFTELQELSIPIQYPDTS